MNNRKKKGSEFKEWVEGIRAKHQIYPTGKGTFLNLLDVCGLTYEVFLHGRIGHRYFGIFKSLFSSLFILSMMILSNVGFEVGGVISPYTPGIVKIWPEIDFPAWKEFITLDYWGRLYGIITGSYVSWRKAYASAGFNPPAWEGNQMTFTACMIAMVINARLIWAHVRARLPGFEDHGSSSGEPWWWVWGPVYIAGEAIRSRGDIVKGVFEPVLCFVLAMYWRKGVDENWLHEDTRFVSVWLYFGFFILALKAWIENNWRKKQTDDAISAKANRAGILASLGIETGAKLSRPKTVKTQPRRKRRA